MGSNNILTLIKERRSIRKFKEGQVSDIIIDEIIEAGQWSPSGKNNQPWRFSIIRNREIKSHFRGQGLKPGAFKLVVHN